MSDYSFILDLHKTYPGMELADFVKALFQGSFGPKHYQKSEEEVIAELEKEKMDLKQCGYDPSIEKLGETFSRVYLSKVVSSDLSLLTYVRLFEASQNVPGKGMEDFKRGLMYLLDECETLGINKYSAVKFLADYTESGFPPLSHSKAYEKLYHPHYLLLANKYCDLLPYFAKIDSILIDNGDVNAYLKSLPYSISSELFTLWPAIYPLEKRPSTL